MDNRADGEVAREETCDKVRGDGNTGSMLMNEPYNVGRVGSDGVRDAVGIETEVDMGEDRTSGEVGVGDTGSMPINEVSRIGWVGVVGICGVGAGTEVPAVAGVGVVDRDNWRSWATIDGLPVIDSDGSDALSTGFTTTPF